MASRAAPLRRPVSFVAISTLFFLAACGHSEPFQADPPGLDEPLEATEPAQLTYSRAYDGPAAWAGDGSAIVYGRAQDGSVEGDRCLALLPAGGGTVRAQLCPPATGTGDSVTTYDLPAMGPDGRIAFYAVARRRGATTDARRELYVAASLDARPTRLRTVPFQTHYNAVSSLHWLDESRLLFVGEADTALVVNGLPTAARVGRHVVTLEASAGATPSLVAGIADPTSVSPDGAGGFYYTLAGDSRVLHRSAAGGDAPVYDFGAGVVVRDVHVSSSRLVAVVGGKVHLSPEGLHLVDDGGQLVLLDLGTGTPTPLGARMPGSLAGFDLVLFRRPRLSPTGDRIVVEAAGWDIVTLDSIRRDTVMTRGPDLWTFHGL